jgi:hypothetical protein
MQNRVRVVLLNLQKHMHFTRYIPSARDPFSPAFAFGSEYDRHISS